ncbi:MAG: hypothetical protein ABIA63_00455, partial [bacterium]
KVTNLNSSGAGSFKEAVQGNEPKIIVFEVSGIIRIKEIYSTGDNTTIAGQTSPAGITLYNWPTDILPKNDRFDDTAENGELNLGNNNILRHIRIRGSQYKGHIISASGSAENPKRNIIFDHVTVSWSGDESITIYSNCQNVTIQWCTIEEAMGFWHGEGGHNYGPFCGGGAGNYCIYYTLMAHQKKRNPEFQLSPGLIGDVRNNVQYDANGVYVVCLHREPDDFPVSWSGRVNVMGNYRKLGPSNSDTKTTSNPWNVWYYFPKNYADTLSQENFPELFMNGNLVTDPSGNELRRDLYYNWVDDSEGGGADPAFLDNPVQISFDVPSSSAEETYDLVVAHAGAWPRDSTTRRTINEVKTGTGGWVMMDSSIVKLGGQWDGWAQGQYPFPYTRFYKPEPNDWPNLPCSTDSDNDGMPDWWEDSVGLDKNMAYHNGTDLSVEGYTNIEVYINALADSLVGYVPPATFVKPGNYSNLIFCRDNFTVFPNPFSNKLTIKKNPSYISQVNSQINIYNVNGLLIRQIPLRNITGNARGMIQWDGLDNNGRNISAGNYYIRISTVEKISGKLNIIKLK